MNFGVRARINDPVKKDILASMTPPHPFGAKRNSLEQRYYEVFNQGNVDIIDVRKSPIIEITEEGVKTALEDETKVDVIIFATGFDGILSIDITTDDNKSLQDKWKNGEWTNAGMTTADFPNLLFANGPSLAEIQGDWIVRLLV